MAAPSTADTQRKHPPQLPQSPHVREEVAAGHQDVFSLDEGKVTISWPASLSRESFEDVSAWLDIVKRKIGRSVVKPQPKGPIDFSRPHSEIFSDEEQH